MDSYHSYAVNQELERAANLAQKGQISAAKELLQPILLRDPNNASALQLLGVLTHQEGNLREAERLMRRSLAVKFDQPHVLNNLANLLNRQGRLYEAVEAYREALRYKPDYVEAWINLGLTYAARDHYEEALKAYDQALKFEPMSAKALNSKGLALQTLGRTTSAEAALSKAAELAPRDPSPLNNLGNLLRRRGEDSRAVACFERALALVPKAAHLRVALAGAHFSLGRFDEAERCLREALEQEPANIDAHWALISLLHLTGRSDRIPESYENALSQIPEAAGLWAVYVGTLWQLERYEASLEVLKRGVRACGDHPIFDLWRGRILVSAGEPERALACLNPESDGGEGLPGHQVAIERARAYLRLGEFVRGADELAPIAFSDHADYSLWAYLELLWRLAGDDRASWLLDYERFVRLMEVPVPEGFSGHEEFNRSLRECLDPLHLTRAPPLDQTERGGSKTHGELFERTEPLITLLRNAIERAIFEYVDALPSDTAHPFLRYKGVPIRFSGSWSVRLFAEGYHIAHYHPEGWVSSAYYVSFPASVADPTTQEGRIYFGIPPVQVPCASASAKTIQPEVGKLVLFPSYCWHGTYPFRASEPRFTVAFDVARPEVAS